MIIGYIFREDGVFINAEDVLPQDCILADANIILQYLKDSLEKDKDKLSINGWLITEFKNR